MSSSEKEKESSLILAIDDSDTMLMPRPQLEAPPEEDNAVTSLSGALLSDDSLPVLSAKLTAHEGMLRILTQNHTYHDFMRELLLTVMKVVRSEAGSIFEIDDVNQVLFFRAVVGQSSDQLPKFTVPIGQGIVGHVAESRQPLVVDNVKENKLHLKAIQSAVGFDARNLVALPIMVRGKIFAVLELLNRVGEATYTASDIELLTYLCDCASKVLEVRLMLSWALQNARTTNDSSSNGKKAA